MSTRGSGIRQVIPPKLQSVIRNPFAFTQNQWYDAWTGTACAAGAGSTKANCRIHFISFDQATNNETIQIRIIADLLDQTAQIDATAGTDYYL